MKIRLAIVTIYLAIGISIIGFIITLIGAFLNGLSMFNGRNDLLVGFGLILIGNSISFFGIIIIALIFLLSIFKVFYSEVAEEIS